MTQGLSLWDHRNTLFNGLNEMTEHPDQDTAVLTALD